MTMYAAAAVGQRNVTKVSKAKAINLDEALERGRLILKIRRAVLRANSERMRSDCVTRRREWCLLRHDKSRQVSE